MANTLHTGIPILQWVGAYPPCTPSVVISADLNPFCSGDDVMFTPVFDCVDTAVNTEVKYGLLYNWYAATDARLITSADIWRIPTEDAPLSDITNLINLTSGQSEQYKETGTEYWQSPNAYATNLLNFNGRGSGIRYGDDGSFASIQTEFLFLCNTPGVYTISLGYIKYNDNVFEIWYGTEPKNGVAIRLTRDATEAEQLLADGTACANYVGNDGKKYPTVKIGTQVWTAANSAETKYRNRDLIPEVTDNAAWAALETGALCAYNNDWNNAYTEKLDIQSYAWMINGVIKSTSPDPFVTSELNDGDRVNLLFITPNGNTYFSNTIVVQEKTEGCPDLVKYGLLYNWYAATDARKITSSDTWVVPTLAEQGILRTYLGGSSVAGAKLKETGLTYWDSPNLGATNEVGFNGRGAGVRNTNGTFATGRFRTELWIIASNYTFGGGLLKYNNINFGQASIGTANKWGFSIRLFRIATAPEQLLADGTACTPYVGNDGKIYRTVKIGTQVWTAANSAETKYRNGDTIPEVTDNAAWAALTTGAMCAFNNDWNNV